MVLPRRPSQGRQDRRRHQRPDPRRDNRAPAACPLCLRRAVSIAGQIGRLGLSETVRRASDRGRQRGRTAADDPHRGQDPVVRRGQRRRDAWPRVRRRLSRRVRRLPPLGLGKRHPTDALGPAGLGGDRRHAEGPQSVPRGRRSRAEISGLVFPAPAGQRQRHPAGNRAPRAPRAADAGPVRPGVRVLVRRGHPRRVLRRRDARGARRWPHPIGAARPGADGLHRLGHRLARRHRDLVVAGRGRRDPRH